MSRARSVATFVVPPLAGVLALVHGGQRPSMMMTVLFASALVVSVLAAVGHAERIAHRVGEPYGTLVLAVAVTVIEVALIVVIMIAGGPAVGTLARDTVFAAVMIVCNGVLGGAFLLNASRTHLVRFSSQGANALLATLVTITALGMVVPSFTRSAPTATSTPSQLAFSAVAAAAVYGVFVFVQTGRHRWMFLSPEALRDESDDTQAHVRPHAPTTRTHSLAVLIPALIVSLAVVVVLAKALSPRLDELVTAAGAPRAFVGVMIAVLVLLPESITAFRAAARNEMQTSINLALGSAVASVGMTIPAIAVASIWLDGPITFGLGSTEIVLLVTTVIVTALTFGSGQATVLQAAVHLALFSAFIFLSLVP